MSRPLRIEFPGALYHVTSRGDRLEPIFEDDGDRKMLLRILANCLDRFDAVCIAYCLMGNHYHLVVQTRSGNLARIMRHLNGVYTQRYNRRHGKVGHLFQGRYAAVLVDHDAYFLQVCRYVDLNPVRARQVRHPEEWTWSSYRAHAGLTVSPAWLMSESVHRQLAPHAPQGDGPARYVQFVAQGTNARLWESGLVAQIYLGNETFRQRVQSRHAPMPALASREVPAVQRRVGPKALEAYFAPGAERDVEIVNAFREGGYTQTAIARACGLSVSRVSRVLARRKAQDDA